MLKKGLPMSTIKPIVDEQTLATILAEHFKEHARDLQPIEIGQIARTFSFRIDHSHYIIRINSGKMDANFEKEAFIARTYSSTAVPIPEVVQHGQFNELHYCITRKAAGHCFDKLPAGEIERAIPYVMMVLNAIHATDVSRQERFGLFDGEGRGFFDNWPASLAFVKEEERADGFFGKWHRLFETTFLERDLFERLYGHFEGLLEHCPNERHLVHGGFGFGNLLVEDGRVTAVIDWLDAKFGDFLYDVAWLDYYDAARSYAELFRANYAARDIALSCYPERILCYQCYIALDGLRFFALSENAQMYNWTKARILGLLSR